MKPDIQDSAVFTALRAFLSGLFPDVEVIQTQQNRAPPPRGAFVAMSNVGKRRLSTNLRTYTDTDATKTQNTVMPTEYTVQVDPQQIPLISGEKQFVERWKTEAKIQINPVVSVPMDFFSEPSLTLIPVPLKE